MSRRELPSFRVFSLLLLLPSFFNFRQMSTFDGIVEEFPYIQIDYFRKSPERPPPLACFLSHVHSDHLQGLESFRAPFIYCSGATKELLLRIEKFPHRMNFSKGILESRRLHYKHLSKLLRPIPLNTPTEIELTPRLRIRVTLIDANHCAGSVMFLIEGDGKAILYTGDIRAETWWTNSLIRHPVLIPYTLGKRRLDKIYLDTTFAITSNIYRTFPSKAEGLAELVKKVEDYPGDTVFYFRAWTFGYEDVWVTLSAALNTRVHLDRYQFGLYKSLASGARGGSLPNEAPPLCGFDLGNRFAPGCLSDDENCRIHSCEPGASCLEARSRKTVYIIPIVNRMDDGLEISDTGTGGGTGDLYQTHELELPDESALDELEKLCLQHIDDDEVLSRTTEALFTAFRSKNKSLSLDIYGMKDDSEMSLKELVAILSQAHSDNTNEKISLPKLTEPHPTRRKEPGQDLPNTIRFPYSRHSSYSELCELVSAFKPKDIFPCTVDATTWNEDVSIRRLFGHLCSGNVFAYDAHMREVLSTDEHGQLHPRKKARYDVDFSSQSNQSQQTSTNSDFGMVMEDDTFHHHYQKSNISTTSRSPQSLRSEKRTQTAESAGPNPPDKIQIPNEPLRVPELSPRAENAKRTEIRRARGFLRWKTQASVEGQVEGEDSGNENGILCIGSLPSSWGEEEKDSHDGHDFANVEDLYKDTNLDLIMKSTNIEKEQGRSQGHEKDERDNEKDSRSTTSSLLSISDSAFDSERQQSLHMQPDDDDDDDDGLGLTGSDLPTTSTDDNNNNNIIINKNCKNNNNINDSHNHNNHHQHKQIQHNPIRAQTKSLRTRKEAYRAARADSYEAWSSVSLLSAGNNHSIEEMEL